MATATRAPMAGHTRNSDSSDSDRKIVEGDSELTSTPALLPSKPFTNVLFDSVPSRHIRAHVSAHGMVRTKLGSILEYDSTVEWGLGYLDEIIPHDTDPHRDWFTVHLQLQLCNVMPPNIL